MFTFFHITVFNWMDQKIRKRKRKDFFDIPNIFLWKKVDIIITQLSRLTFIIVIKWFNSSFRLSSMNAMLNNISFYNYYTFSNSFFFFLLFFFSLFIVKMKWFLIDSSNWNQPNITFNVDQLITIYSGWKRILKLLGKKFKPLFSFLLLWFIHSLICVSFKQTT